MGRDLLQSLIKAMTMPRQECRERRVTSCLVHPRRTTGTVPAAAASATCSNPCLWEAVLFPSALAWLQLGGSGATVAAGPSIALACCAAACSNGRLSSGKFPLETHRSIYQRRLETSESGEVKLTLNEPIKAGEGQTRLEAGQAPPGLRDPLPPCATCSPS